MKEIERKLAAARTNLILEKPFLGALVLRLPLVEARGSWCQTSATDARSIYYNTSYINSLSLSQVQFVLAHEAMHCGLFHFARREYRDINRWNIACDHAVNPLLVEDGLELPPGALYNEEYTGLAAEEIYPLIKNDTEEQTQDQHLYDNPESDPNSAGADQQQGDDQSSPGEHSTKPNTNDPHHRGKDSAERPGSDSNRSEPDQHESGERQQRIPEQKLEPITSGEAISGQNKCLVEIHNDQNDRADSDLSNSSVPSPLSQQEKEQLKTKWQQRLVSAAQQASQAGKMNGSVARLVERFLRSTVPWRTLLARFMSGSSRTDYNLQRPSQRRSGDAILPSLHTRQTNAVIALDTSGSIEQDELTLFIAEVNALKSLVNARITLLACDSQLDEDGPWIYEPWDQLVLPKTLQGGGGTDFNPVFDWMQFNLRNADLLIYFTDAVGRFPVRPPRTETLWLVKGTAPVPWGQRIQLN